jgi:hypothetical protein
VWLVKLGIDYDSTDYEYQYLYLYRYVYYLSTASTMVSSREKRRGTAGGDVLGHV